MYRSSIGLDGKYKFGVEIEFFNIHLMKVYSSLVRSGIPTVFYLKHKRNNPTYKEWILDIDSSVTESDGERIIGGELSSRILTDSENCWSELKNLCTILKNLNGYPSKKCGLHVNVDISSLLDNPLFLEILIKLFFVYENDINLFFMGDKFFVRDTKEKYAYSFGDKIINRIDDNDLFKNDNILNNNFFKLCALNKHCGLNLGKIQDNGLLEVRYGNGTLDYAVIQDFCNFVLKIIYAIENNKIDLDFLDYRIKCIKKDPLFKFKLDNFSEDVDSFLSLLKNISTSSLDYDCLSSRYLNVINSRAEQKIKK